MPVYVNETYMPGGKLNPVKYGKKGRYGLMFSNGGIYDVADTLDEARKKAVKLFKYRAKNVRYDDTLHVYIRSANTTVVGTVGLMKNKFGVKNGEITFEYGWDSGCVYRSKNVNHPLDPKTGKLLK